MTVVKVEFRANGNFSDLVAQVDRVNASVIGLNASLNSINSEKVNQAFKEFSTFMTKSGQYTSQMVQITSNTEKFGKALMNNKLKLGDYYREFSQFVTKRDGQIRKLARQQVMMERSLVVAQGRTATGQLKAQVFTPTGLDKSAATQIAIARKEMQIFNDVLSKGSTALVNWGKNTQWAGRQLTVGLTVPISIFGTTAAKTFYEADQQLVRLQKVYGSTLNTVTNTQQIQEVRTQVVGLAKELAQTYGAAINDTMGLAADVAATGKEGNDLIETTRQTTRLAVLGEVDRQDAMKATLAIQTAFKQNNEELGNSINFLNAVENQTSLSLEDLITAIPKAGPVVKSLGGNIKELALMMTAMKEGGIPAAEAANALKSGLASIINPSQKAKDSMKAFGIDIDSIVEKNKGKLMPTIMDLQKSLEGLEPLARSRIIEQLFGKYQFSRMSALFSNLGKQGSQTVEVMKLMKASTQELGQVAENELNTMTQSVSGKFNRSWQTMKANLMVVGEQFLKFGTKVIDVGNKIFEFFNKMPDGAKRLLTIVTIVTALVGPVIMFAGIMGNFLGYLAKGLILFRTFGKAGAGAFKMLGTEEIAAKYAGDLLEQTLFDEAKAAGVMDTAVGKLTATLRELAAAQIAANEAMVVGTAEEKASTSAATAAAGTRMALDASRHTAHTVPVQMQQNRFGVDPGKMWANYIATTVPMPGAFNIGSSGAGKNIASVERLFDPAVHTAAALEGMMENAGVILQKDYARMQADAAAIELLIQDRTLSTKLFTEKSKANDATILAALRTEEGQATEIVQNIENKINQIWKNIVATISDVDEQMIAYTTQVDRLLTEEYGIRSLGGTLSESSKTSHATRRRMETTAALTTTGTRGEIISPVVTQAAAQELLVVQNGVTKAAADLKDAGLPVASAADKLSQSGQKVEGDLVAGANAVEEAGIVAGNNIGRGGEKAAKFMRGLSTFGLAAGTIGMMGGGDGIMGKIAGAGMGIAMASPLLEMAASSPQFVKLGDALKNIGKGAAGASGKVGILAKGMAGLRGVAGTIARLAPMAFGPWGIAIAGTIGAIILLSKRAADNAEKIRNQYSMTAESAEMLGTSVATLSGSFNDGSQDVNEYAQEISNLIKQLDELDSKEMNRIFADKLKGADLTKAKEVMGQWWNSAIAQGADPEKLKKVMDAAIQRAGLETMSLDLKIFIDQQSTDKLENVRLEFTTLTTQMDKYRAAAAAAGTVQNGINNRTQRSALDARRANIELEAMTETLKNITAQTAGGNILDFSSTSQQLANVVEQGGVVGAQWEEIRLEMVSQGGLVGEMANKAKSYADFLNLAYLAMHNMVPAATEVGRQMQIAMAAMQAAGDKSADKSKKDLVADIWGMRDKNKTAPGGGTAKSSAGGGDPYKKQKDAINDQIKQQDKLIDAINKRRDAEKKALEEKKKQMEFEKQMYEMQIGYREAIASGDFAAAAVAKNNMAIARKEHAADKKEDAIDKKYDKQVDAHEKKKESLQDQLDKLNDLSDAARDAANAAAAGINSTTDAATNLQKRLTRGVNKMWADMKGHTIRNKNDMKKYMSVDLRNTLKALGIDIDSFLTGAWKNYAKELDSSLKRAKESIPGWNSIVADFGKNTTAIKAIAKGLADGKNMSQSIADALRITIPKDAQKHAYVNQMIVNDANSIIARAGSAGLVTDTTDIFSSNSASGKALRNKAEKYFPTGHTGGYTSNNRAGAIGNNPFHDGKFKAGEFTAVLKRGEFVMGTKSVDMFGPQFFDDLNRGRLPRNLPVADRVASSNTHVYTGDTKVEIIAHPGMDVDDLYRKFEAKLAQKKKRVGGPRN